MAELQVFDEMSRSKQLAVAIKVANYCTNNETKSGIVPVSVDEIMDAEWALVATVEGIFAGYIRSKEEIVHERTFRTYQSIGTLVVAKSYQRNGIGTMLVKEITNDVSIGMDIPFAFCNKFSLKPFQDTGYIPARPDELPAVAVSAYGNQPMVYPWTLL